MYNYVVLYRVVIYCIECDLYITGKSASALYGFASFTIAFRIASMQPEWKSTLKWNLLIRNWWGPWTIHHILCPACNSCPYESIQIFSIIHLRSHTSVLTTGVLDVLPPGKIPMCCLIHTGRCIFHSYTPSRMLETDADHGILLTDGYHLTSFIFLHHFSHECTVLQKFNLLLFLYFSFVHVIRLITNKKNAFFCVYKVSLSPNNHNPNPFD